MSNYSVNQVNASFAGKPINAGRGDGSFCKIAKVDKGRFKQKAGLDGTYTFYSTGANLHEVTIILAQSSQTNDMLSAIFNGDILTDNGAGIAPLLVNDHLGTSLFNATEARITDLPDEEFAEEPGTLEWVFACPNPERWVGSNG